MRRGTAGPARQALIDATSLVEPLRYTLRHRHLTALESDILKLESIVGKS